jgi:hypothetical protein
MHGIEYDNFEEEVVNKHCIYYYELKPILAERPNVKPWATNFDTDTETEKMSKDDDDSESSYAISNQDVEVIDILSDDNNNYNEPRKQGTVTNVNNTISNVTYSQLTDDICSYSSVAFNNRGSQKSVKTVSSGNSPNKRKETSAAKIAPSDAKQTHDSMIRQRKRQLTWNDSSASTKLTAMM